MTARSVVLSVLLGAHPGLGDSRRIDPPHSGFRHQGTDAAGRADPNGELRGTWSGPRTATGCPDRLLARQRRQDDAINPQRPPMGRHVDDAGDHQRRHRRPHPRGIAERRCSRPAFRRAPRGGLAAAGQSERRADRDDVLSRVRVMHGSRRRPGWARRQAVGSGRLGAHRRQPARGDGSARPTFPVGSSPPRASVRHLLTDPVLPDELLPDDWPGDGVAQGLRTIRRGTGGAARRF